MASTYLSLRVHIIFATKDRAPLIKDEWKGDLHRYLAGTARGLHAHPLAVGGVADHVHMIVGLKATHCVADFVRELKKASSVWAGEKHGKFGWQDGYAAFSVSPNDAPDVIAYIERQEEHHKTISSADELRAILAHFGIEFNEAYFE